MKLTSFVILTVLCVVYAGLTVAEGTAYQTWQKTLADQREVQAKVAHFQRLNGAAQELLQRLAVEAQHDPALAELLKRHDVVVKPVDNQSVLTPDPDAQDKSSPGLVTPTSIHP